MPNVSKSPGAGDASKEVPFEEALKQLESIVEQMESGELPLETMTARFEEGVRLVKTCQKRLEEAEIKISKLEKDASGTPTLSAAQELLNDDE